MFLKRIIKKFLFVERIRHIKLFIEDENFYWHGTHAPYVNKMKAAESRISIMSHIVEKGLTMPARRYGFGRQNILSLIDSIEKFSEEFKSKTSVISHAISVVKEYYHIHQEAKYNFTDDVVFADRLKSFVFQNDKDVASAQLQTTYAVFYKDSGSGFDKFARSRHTVRHYSDVPVPIETIKTAVALAMTAPSACNRQHVRVHCIANRLQARKLLEIQGGNRGFGQLADKVLILTSDLSVELGGRERNDSYVNGGIFLMNLCYALHFYKIAHCILSCSIERYRISEIRKLAKIPANEVIVGMLSCGIAPSKFDVALSPRMALQEILTVKE